MKDLYSLPFNIKHDASLALNKANPILEEPEFHPGATTYFTPHIFKLKHFYGNNNSQISLYLTMGNYELESIPYSKDNKQTIKKEIDNLTQIILSYNPNEFIEKIDCNSICIKSPYEHTEITSQKNKEYLKNFKGSELVIYGTHESFEFGKHLINSAFEKYPILAENIISKKSKKSRLFSIFGSVSNK